MPTSTTIHAIPKPAAGDAVAALDELLRSLGDLLDLKVPQVFRTGPHGVVAVDTSYTAAITFPKPYPSGVVPAVQVTAEVAAPTAIVTVSNVTNTGCTLNYRRVSGTVNVSCIWSVMAP